MRRRLPFLRTLLLLFAGFLLACGLVLYVARIDRVVIAPGQLLGGSSPVRSATAGQVAQVLVQPGQRVQAGQLLVRLDAAALGAQAQQLRARIEGVETRAEALRQRAQRLLDELHPAQRERAQRDLAAAQLRLDSAQKKADLLEPLEQEGLVAGIDYELADLERQLAAVFVEQASADLPGLEASQRAAVAELSAELRSVDAELREQRAASEEVQRRVSQCELSAAVEGLVIGAALHELVGRSVAPGDELFRLAHAPADRFEGVLQDSARSFARTGLPVKIRLQGYPWLLHGTLAGKVEFVSRRRDQGGGFPVVVLVDDADPPGDLYEGMTGQARIVVEADVSLGRLLIEKFVTQVDS